MEITHDLKIWPEYFEQVRTGAKKFEVRLNDRDYKTGDILLLAEYDKTQEKYTGRLLIKVVTCILEGTGLQDGYVILGIEDPKELIPAFVHGVLKTLNTLHWKLPIAEKDEVSAMLCNYGSDILTALKFDYIVRWDEMDERYYVQFTGKDHCSHPEQQPVECERHKGCQECSNFRRVGA